MVGNESWRERPGEQLIISGEVVSEGGQGETNRSGTLFLLEMSRTRGVGGAVSRSTFSEGRHMALAHLTIGDVISSSQSVGEGGEG